MVCYHPHTMFPAKGGGRWTADPRKAVGDGRSFHCNRCQGCRKRKTSEWTVRLMHEAKYHPQRALMVTLTYADAFLPADYSICRKVVQKFLKRLRKRFGCKVRFFAVGEYGDSETGTRRPHFHLILFGLELDDLCDAEESQKGFIQYRSPALESCWTDPASGELRGRVRVSYADWASFSYVAGYVFKKLGGPKAEAEYRRIHPVTGEIVQVQPEFALMSRRPGIGGDWFEEFAESDVRSEFVVVNGRKRALPDYYRRKRDAIDAARRSEARTLAAKIERQAEAEASLVAKAADLTPERLAVREEVHVLRTMHLARGGGS